MALKTVCTEWRSKWSFPKFCHWGEPCWLPLAVAVDPVVYLSLESRDHNSQKLTKATRKVVAARLSLTKNDWVTAHNSRRNNVHLWNIHQKTKSVGTLQTLFEVPHTVQYNHVYSLLKFQPLCNTTLLKCHTLWNTTHVYSLLRWRISKAASTGRDQWAGSGCRCRVPSPGHMNLWAE